MKTPPEVIDIVQLALDEVPMPKRTHIHVQTILTQIKAQFEAEAEADKPKKPKKIPQQ